MPKSAFPFCLWGLMALCAWAQTPATFSWVEGSSDWDAAGAWVSSDPARTAPGVPGDIVSLSATDTVNLSFTGEKTISSLVDLRASWTSLTAGAPGARLIFDNGGDATLTNRIAGGTMHQTLSLALGSITEGLDYDENLEVSLASPLLIHPIVEGSLIVYARGKLTGGTADNPSDIRFRRDGFNEWFQARLTLLHPDNDFRGDLHLGVPGGDNRFQVDVGYRNAIGWNSCLGHPDNKVVLYGNETYLRVHTGDPEGLRRVVEGTGRIVGSSVNPEWTNLSLEEPLYLGSGMDVRPSNPNTGSECGLIRINGYPLTMAEDAVFSLDVLPDGSCDSLVLGSTAALNLCGQFAFSGGDAAPVGTVWKIAEVSKSCGALTLNPAAVTPGYSVSWTGSAADGWEIYAIRNASVDAPGITTLTPHDVAATTAIVPAKIQTLGDAAQATVRIYLNPDTDPGPTASGWAIVREIGTPVTATGEMEFAVEGLEVNRTYYLRHAIATDAGEYFSPIAQTLTTQELTTPDVFKQSVAVTNAFFHDASIWTHDSTLSRMVPGYPGDQADFQMGKWARTFLLTNDVSLATLRITGGENNGSYRLTLEAAEDPVTLRFAGATDGTSRIGFTGKASAVQFGSNLTTRLTVEMTETLECFATSAYKHSYFFWAPLTGGTEEHPLRFDVHSQFDQWTYVRVYLINPANDFRADIHIGEEYVRESYSELYVGHSTTNFTDEMLGHPANEIFLHNNSRLYLSSTHSQNVFKRALHGNGRLSTEWRDEWNIVKGYRGVTFAEGARFSPAGVDGTGYGTLTLYTGALQTEPGVQWRFDVAADGTEGDTVSLRISTGECLLQGEVTVIPDTHRVPVGTAWTLFTIPAAKNLTGFQANLKRSAESLPVRFETEGDAETGWTVTAVAVPEETMLLLR